MITHDEGPCKQKKKKITINLGLLILRTQKFHKGRKAKAQIYWLLFEFVKFPEIWFNGVVSFGVLAV